MHQKIETKHSNFELPSLLECLGQCLRVWAKDFFLRLRTERFCNSWKFLGQMLKEPVLNLSVLIISVFQNRPEGGLKYV